MGEGLARTLIQNNIKYIGIDIKPSKFTTHIGSITDREFVSALMKNVDFVLHTATLHKPHVVTHSRQDFVDTNITGTLNLLEEASNNNVKGFIFTSTTSTFGDGLTPGTDEPAVWITEESVDIPKNIYGVTKNAAEDLCRLSYRNHNLPCLILKTSRFFPEEDDNKFIRENFDDLNIKAIEYLYRRVDVEDIVTAHLLAIENVGRIGFAKYIISATSPFKKEHLKELRTSPSTVIENIYPDFKKTFDAKGWKMLSTIDRVYVNEKARRELHWQPKYDFAYVLNCIQADKDFRSELALATGIKRYHSQTFINEPFPVE